MFFLNCSRLKFIWTNFRLLYSVIFYSELQSWQTLQNTTKSNLIFITTALELQQAKNILL